MNSSYKQSEGGKDMVIRNYKSIKDAPKFLRVIWYVAIVQALVGATLLVMNMLEVNDLPLYVPMMLISSGSLINSAVMCELRNETR